MKKICFVPQAIEPTAEIVEVLKPVYDFKA